MIIPLQNAEAQHLGFLFPAGLPSNFAVTVGWWEGDCVFMAAPMRRELCSDPAFRFLNGHKDAGGHRIVVCNDGSVLSVFAIARTGAQLFVRLPDSAPGTWGARRGSAEVPMGRAVKVA